MLDLGQLSDLRSDNRQGVEVTTLSPQHSGHHTGSKVQGSIVPTLRNKFQSFQSFNRCASFKTFNCAGTTRPKLALLYWNHRRSDKGRIGGELRSRVGAIVFVQNVPIVQPLRSVQVVNRLRPVQMFKGRFSESGFLF